LRLQEDLQKIRKTLLDKGPQTWGELKGETGWSPSVLKNRIDLLMNRGELSATVGKRKGRRTTIYKLTEKDRAIIEIRRYDAIKFIESIKDPTYSSKASDDHKVRVSIFVSPLGDPHHQGKWQRLADANAKIWYPKAKKLIPFPTKPGLKVAVVLTSES